jgi:hypothetical protein
MVRNRIAKASASVTAFAAITGSECLQIPYASQSATPTQNVTYIGIEMPLRSRVRSARRTCGTNDNVVRHAASQPTISTTPDVSTLTVIRTVATSVCALDGCQAK